MTAAAAVNEEDKKKEDEKTKAEEMHDVDESAVGENQTLPTEISEIFEFLSGNEKIIFKSQQIDDPELERAEKVQIAREIYTHNRQTFLMRFGSHLEEHHLADFAHLAIAEGAARPLQPDENYEEMQFLLHDFQRQLHTRKRDVKNRRYAALQDLIAKGEYFSESEMMRRAPELYQELVGQYLSEAERKQRDSYDVKNTTFSSILMHTAEQQQMADVLKQADEQLKCIKTIDNDDDDDDEITLSSSTSQGTLTKATNTEMEEIRSEDDDGEVAVPASFRQQWGNFDNEQIACSTSSTQIKLKPKAPAKPKSCKELSTKFITAGERDLLRDEFVGIMHAEFLAGNDADFDYTQVDDNAQLDDLRQLNQDREDAYFEESDDEATDIVKQNEVQQMSQADEEDSEDELDIYMSHLSKHHSLQKK